MADKIHDCSRRTLKQLVNRARADIEKASEADKIVRSTNCNFRRKGWPNIKGSDSPNRYSIKKAVNLFVEKSLSVEKKH